MEILLCNQLYNVKWSNFFLSQVRQFFFFYGRKLTELLRSRYLVFRVTGIPDKKAITSLLALKQYNKLFYTKRTTFRNWVDLKKNLTGVPGLGSKISWTFVSAEGVPGQRWCRWARCPSLWRTLRKDWPLLNMHPAEKGAVVETWGKHTVINEPKVQDA